MRLKDEEILVGIAAIAMAFIWINVQPAVGAFYSFGIMLYFVPLLARRKDYIVEIIDKKTKLIPSACIAAVLVVVWILGSSAILSYGSQSEVALQDVFKNVRAHTNLPVLGDDDNANLATYGIAIPFVESLIFLSFVLMLCLKIFNVKLGWYGPKHPLFWKMVWVCAIVGVTGSLFHLTTRLMDDVALAVDFIFFFTSSVLVFRFKRLVEAVLYHMYVNTGVLLIGGAGS